MRRSVSAVSQVTRLSHVTCHCIVSVHDILVHHGHLVLLLSYPGSLEADNLDPDDVGGSD